jgi:hypothetical protein
VVIHAAGTGLRDDSVLFCEELTTIDKAFLEEGPSGRVSRDLLDQVVIAVRRALGDFSTLDTFFNLQRWRATRRQPSVGVGSSV